MNEKEIYLAPDLTLFSVEVETGFSVSNDNPFGHPGENPDWNDYGEF